MSATDSSIAWCIGLVRYEPSVIVIAYGYPLVMQGSLYFFRPRGIFRERHVQSLEGGAGAEDDDALSGRRNNIRADVRRAAGYDRTAVCVAARLPSRP